jgi:sterol desaturase/sphingolipid hydroxylase (fatty acid hydroxylase superfamily)
MNFVVSFRQAWLAPLFKIPIFSLLPLFGLEPTVIVVVGAVSTFWGVVGHTQIVPSLGLALSKDGTFLTQTRQRTSAILDLGK